MKKENKTNYIHDFDVVILKDGREGTVADVPKTESRFITVDFAQCTGDPDDVKSWNWWFESIPVEDVKKIIRRQGMGAVDIDLEDK